MNRLLLAVALWVGLAGGAWARTVEEQLLATLRSQGYEILEQGYTFLGRLRVVAQNGELRREIVVNPGTGEILRDYAVMLPAIAAAGTGSAGTSTSSGTPSHGSGTTVGVASGTGTVTGEPGGTTVLSTGSTGPDTQHSTGGGMADGLVAPEVIVIDPILPFSADDQ